MVLCCVFDCFSQCPWWLLIIGVGVTVKAALKLTTGVYRGKERLDGKTVIITGATAGIGLFCAKDFAKRGARVIMTGRDMIKGEKVRQEIIKETKNKNVILKRMDFASIENVRSCANEILSEESRIDILLNNAGAGGLKAKKSIDGYDLTMQTNYIGPYLFTVLLLGKIKKSAPSRIVNVSSIAHWIGSLNLEKLTECNTNDVISYSNTKLANILFTKELAKKLKGTGVTVNSLHPGAFYSEITREAGFIFNFIWKLVFNAFFKSIEEASQTSIYLCVSPDVANVTGEYFSDCKLARTSKAAKNEGLAKKLWEKTERLVNLRPAEKH